MIRSLMLKESPPWNAVRNPNCLMSSRNLAVLGTSVILIMLLFLTKNRSLLISVLAIEIFLCLLDQNRVLPWEYLYIFIIVVFIVNANTPGYIMPAIILILASTYFYSGLCKLNEGFLHIVWGNMILHAFFKVPLAMIGKTRTCRIFAGLFIGSGSFSTGTVWRLSFWALTPIGEKIRQQSPRK